MSLLWCCSLYINATIRLQSGCWWGRDVLNGWEYSIEYRRRLMSAKTRHLTTKQGSGTANADTWESQDFKSCSQFTYDRTKALRRTPRNHQHQDICTITHWMLQVTTNINACFIDPHWMLQVITACYMFSRCRFVADWSLWLLCRQKSDNVRNVHVPCCLLVRPCAILKVHEGQ